MSKFYSVLKRLTRNDATYLAHRFLLRAVYGNRLQRLANRDMFHRPEWFWASRPVPVYRVERPASSGGLSATDKKLLIADLLTSFDEAQKLDKENSSYSALWRWNVERTARDFIDALVRKDAQKVLSFLEGMLSQPALWGIGYGDFGIWQGDRFASFLIFHQLVGLAESLALVRTECPEQGEIGYAFDVGVESLVEKIEQTVGVRMDFPRVASSYGIMINGRMLDMQTPSHLYSAYRLRKNLEKYVSRENYSVLEIGAGFGGSAYWFLQQLPRSKYCILDLALTNVYQGWFLSNTLGRDNVLLFSDALKGAPIGSRQVSIMPTRSEGYLGETRFDAIFNQDSFPEMTEQAIDDYLRLAHQRLDGILYSFNHESFSLVKGHPLPWVPDRVQKVGGFKRLSRELSWVRRGYVEEVYRLTAPSGAGVIRAPA
jgi:hypothetical protein